MNFDPTTLAIPIFAIAIGIEFAYDFIKKANEYEITDTFTNIALGAVSIFWGALFVYFYSYIFDWFYSISPIRLPNVWWVWVVALILDDFFYYWYHRFSHESRFLWNFHVVHHSSEHYNLSVALRQSWFSNSVNWIFYLPMALLGFPLSIRAAAHGFNLIYQFFIHTKFVPKLGNLEYFLNTPSHHRVHHGVNNPYLDKNYAGIFILWDRLFGTFVEEDELPRYGIIKPIKSFNWLWINTHAWAEMWEAMKSRQTLFGKLRCIFGSPNMDFK
ncbi:MAG TPA: sterol desaturase family protein [Pyrinomonadaceae bacterium]|nr:sterol desaturase family protein [Pyrinomonadaceae bacterium]